MKYKIDGMSLFIAARLSIQPMWVIEEYAMIDRRCTWFIPIIPPIRAFIAARSRIALEKVLVIINEIMANGASFCHVDRIKHDSHEIETITDGYHK